MEPGSSKKRKASSSQLKPLIGRRGKPTQFPQPKQLCQCTECLEHPGCDPQTGLPTSGRWIVGAEYKDHCKRERNRAVARLKLPLPIPPALNFDKSVDLSPNSSLFQGDSSPIAEIAHRIPGISQSPHMAQSSSTDSADAVNNNLTNMYNQILPAIDVVSKNCIVFKIPPKSLEIVGNVKADAIENAIEQLSPDEIKLLCTLDPNIDANSPVIGYRDMLHRTREFSTAIHASPPNTRSKLKSRILLEHVNREILNLQTALLDVWKAQRLQAMAGNAHDTCEIRS